MWAQSIPAVFEKHIPLLPLIKWNVAVALFVRITHFFCLCSLNASKVDPVWVYLGFGETEGQDPKVDILTQNGTWKFRNGSGDEIKVEVQGQEAGKTVLKIFTNDSHVE